MLQACDAETNSKVAENHNYHSTTMSERAAVNKYNPISERHWNCTSHFRYRGYAVVPSITIPETVSLSSLQFQVSHNTIGNYTTCNMNTEQIQTSNYCLAKYVSQNHGHRYDQVKSTVDSVDPLQLEWWQCRCNIQRQEMNFVRGIKQISTLVPCCSHISDLHCIYYTITVHNV